MVTIFQTYNQMQKKIVFFAIIWLLFSCKSDQLTNSYIYFDQPQPLKVKEISSFPKKYTVTFNRDYSHFMKIESNYVISIQINRLEATKKQMDSLPNFEFKNNVVYDKETQKAFKTYVKNDSIQWETESPDTLFSFADNEIAKIYKSNLFLNKEIDGKYLVNVIKFDLSGNKYLQLGTRNDFLKIQNELQIAFNPIVEKYDTIGVVLNPSRSDFRKLLQIDGFEYEKIYYFK